MSAEPPIEARRMTSRFRVVVTDFLTVHLGPELQVLGELAEVVALDARREDDLFGKVEDADALLVYHNISVTRRTIERLTRCQLIVRCGVGYDNIDFAFARSRGIPVANVPDYGTEEVADSAIGLTLALARGLNLLNRRFQADPALTWQPFGPTPLGRLRGRTFAVVGLGRIGTAAARRAQALGMEVAFYDPFKPDGYDKALGIRRSETLAELLGRSHVLSLHCPLTPATHRLIDAAALAQLPRGAYLVNTARGAVVDTPAVVPAIESGQLAGVGLDVLPQEPPAADDPLLRAWRDPAHPAHERVIINPHAAFYSEEGLLDMRTKGAEAVRRALLGQPLRNVVN
jgi:C-terminal binding protein